MKRGDIFAYFSVACDIAMKARAHNRNGQKAVIGAIGIRSDGRIVHAHNAGAGEYSPDSHAEARLSRKLDKYATVYVARIKRDTYTLALARPCFSCLARLKFRKVKKVYYSINEHEYGVIEDLQSMVLEEDSRKLAKCACLIC